uniref:Uncharacterized protein n=1 Tax=Schistosoma japonicum TaxID=6182 RepID=G9DCT4_SCHJA|nr:hypothetical protein [Schistosoma japonicum]
MRSFYSLFTLLIFTNCRLFVVEINTIMTLEGFSNFRQSIPSANFSGSCLANAHQINNSYHHQNSQTLSNYPPLFHPAAVAAAAAEYTQHFNSGVISRPLNLTANPNGPNPYFSSADTSRAYYALQQSGLYHSTNTFNNFGGVNVSQDFSFPNSTTSVPSLSTETGFSPCEPASTIESGNGSKSRHGSSVKNSKTSTSSSVKLCTKSAGVRGRKSISSEEVANRKRQEFNELVKARTEKLMSDGPVLNPTINPGPLSSSSSAGSTVPESGLPNYRKLIYAVLDAKTSALLRSPSVIHFLSNQQHSLTEYKRQTELFCVTMNR